MMDKKTILIAVAFVAVFIGGQFLITKLFPPIPKKAPAAVTNAVASVTETNVPAAKPEVVAPAAKTEQELSAPLPAEKLVVLQNEFARVTVTSWGGGIRTVELLKYQSDAASPVVLNADAPMPALALMGTGGTNTAYELEQSSSKSVLMRARLPGGAQVVKTLELGENYVLTGKVFMSAAPAQPVRLVVGTELPASDREGLDFLGVDWLAADYQTRHFSAISKSNAKEKFSEQVPARWMGVKNQFFAMLLTPASPAESAVYSTVHPNKPAGWKEKAAYEGVTGALEFPLTKSQDGSWTMEFSLYAGPKEYKRLAALGGGQEYLMDFGMFKIIAVWLLHSMLFFHGLIPNYGVAIILITIAIKIIFWPVQAKSIKSMKAMQQFQPLMAKIKEKYKDDPKRQQQEIMRLYKEHKINPMSGCLPMLVQIPVFFALFAMLRSAVELRGAGFLWIQDLSRPDTIFSIAGMPFNPLPLLMTGSMIWQQKITPTTGDAQQQKILMFMMPVMMLWFLYSASSGLTLYWTVQQFLSIAQQWWSLRKEPQPALAAPTKSK